MSDLAWLHNTDIRNGLGLAFSALLWLCVALQTARRGWLLIALWFTSTSVYFAVRAGIRLMHFDVPSWIDLQSPLLELTLWVMNALMVAVWFALRQGWYAGSRDD